MLHLYEWYIYIYIIVGRFEEVSKAKRSYNFVRYEI